MNEDDLATLVDQLPDDWRARMPVDKVTGRPRVEIVHALYRHERVGPGEVRWTEVRELDAEEWGAAIAAHGSIYRYTRGFDGFPAFAWGDLDRAREELLRQVRVRTTPDEWMVQLVEYRLLNFSSALKAYDEYICAEASRVGGEVLVQRIKQELSTVYDRSFGYRLIYAMRNSFLHGARRMFSLTVTARLVEGSESERESEGEAILDKEAFACSRANAAVRREAHGRSGDVRLFELAGEVFSEVEALQGRLNPLLYPEAPAAADLLTTFFHELGGERPHFHEYIRGLPAKGLLGITSLDRGGFDYVARRAGVTVDYGDQPPTGALDVLPRYTTEASEDRPA